MPTHLTSTTPGFPSQCHPLPGLTLFARASLSASFPFLRMFILSPSLLCLWRKPDLSHLSFPFSHPMPSRASTLVLQIGLHLENNSCSISCDSASSFAFQIEPLSTDARHKKTWTCVMRIEGSRCGLIIFVFALGKL